MRRLAVGICAVLALVALACVVTGLVYDPDPAPLRLSRQTVEVDGTRLSFHQRGRGPDVVLVHGGMGSAEDFEPILEPLEARFRVTAVDRPGFGLSRAHGEDPTYPGNARLLGGLIRALHLDRPVVVGHSHGGGVALTLAQSQPQLLRGIVLVAAAAYPDRSPTTLDRLGPLPLFGEGLPAWVGPWLGGPGIAAVLNPMIAPDGEQIPMDFVLYRQKLWNNPRSLAVKARQAVTDRAGLEGIAAGLGGVQVPAVVVGCSEDSTERTSVDSKRLARDLPRAQLVWLEGCGHFVQYARPDEVVQAIVDAAGKS